MFSNRDMIEMKNETNFKWETVVVSFQKIEFVKNIDQIKIVTIFAREKF